MTHKTINFAAGLAGFTGVALGAFGAHALKDALAAHDSTQTWHTATLYHLVHAVAALAVGLAGNSVPGFLRAAVCWLVGIVLFSGSLYWLALGGPSQLLGPVTPLGGVWLLAGWLLVAIAGWKGGAKK